MLKGAAYLTLLGAAGAVHDCDSEHGTHCPSDFGEGLHDCLTAKLDEHSGKCQDYIRLHETCKEDLKKYCNEAWYNENDIPLCLGQWNRRDVSAECLEFFPEKQEEEPEKIDPEKARWRAERKKARQESMDAMKNEKKKKKKDKKKKKKKKSDDWGEL